MKSRNVKIVTLALLMSVACSCNEEVDIPIPDLNPGTEEGGDITIYDIGEVVEFYSFSGYTEPQFRVYNTEFDIGGEGDIDLRLIGRYSPALPGSWYPYGGLDLRFNAQLIHMPDDNYDGDDNRPGYSFPVFLPVDALTGSTINGIWSPAFAPLEV